MVFFEIFRPLITCFLLCWTCCINAQVEQCYAEVIAQRNAALYPELAQQRAQIRAAIDAQAADWGNWVGDRGVVTIPVVFHVVYKTSVENITEAQILSQIDVLNEDFRKLNFNAGNVPADFSPFAADIELEFCLASVDPAGNPTTGITRRQTIWDNVSNAQAPDGRPRICYQEVGGTNAWDSKRYLNIWVAKIGSGILGYATFPGSVPDGEDGVFIDPRYLGRTGLAVNSVPNHLGRTCTHEVGHYFDLYHIWGGNTNVCDDDDGVGDTPVQRGSFTGCPTHPQFSCGNKSMFMNYMDYTSDGCVALFTQGQKARMLATLSISRAGLKSSTACGLSSVDLPSKSEPEIVLSPNPASDEVSVVFSVPTDIYAFEISLIDVLGRRREIEPLVVGENRMQIPTQNLPAGTYWVQLNSKNGVIIKPFVKI